VLSLTDAQKKKAYSATPQSVTLVRIETYTDHAAKTVDEVLYFATLPLLYRWDGATVNHWRGFVESVGPLARGFSHIPTDAELSTRDGLRVNFAADEWGTLNIWWLLTEANLVGAKIEVATLLLDWQDSSDGSWIDQSATTADHIVRFRGEVTQIPEYAAEATTFQLVADSVEPPINFGQALAATEVSEKDLGKLYPLPIGSAKRVPLVQRQVGWVTTLITDLAPAQLGYVLVSDASGFAADPAVLNLWIGTEKLTATKVSQNVLDIIGRGQSSGTTLTTSVAHKSGQVLIEEIESARFVTSGVPTIGLDRLYAKSPSSGELLFIPNGWYGFQQSDPVLDPGYELGVVSFTAQLWANVIRLLNNEAKVTQQPAYAGGPPTVLSDTPTRNTTWIEPVISIDTDMFLSGSLYKAIRNTTVDERGFIFWLDGDLASIGSTVTRYRAVFNYVIHTNSINTTVGKFMFTDDFLNADSSHSFQLSPIFVSDTVVGAATAWTNCPVGTVVGDASNGVAGFSEFQPHIEIGLGIGTGGSNPNTWFEVDISSIVLEMETPAAVIVQTFAAITTGAQEIGFNVDLYADLIGVATLGTETPRTEFDDATGWTPDSCTITSIAPGPADGFQINGNGTGFIRSGFKAVVADVSGSRMKFEYKIFPGMYAIASQAVDFFLIALSDSGGNNIFWQWPRSCFHDDAQWHEFVFDSSGTGTQIRSAVGSLDVTDIVQVNLAWTAEQAIYGGQMGFRNLSFEARTHPTNPIDVAKWVIEENAGLSADVATFATARTNLPAVNFAGDLRNAGATLGDVLARIGLESRTNFIMGEGASGSVVKAYNALTTFAFTAAARSLGTNYRGLITRSRQLDERTTDFMAVYDFRNDLSDTDLEGYRALIQANATTNDISARVATATITAQQALVGVRPTDPMPFLLVPDLASAIEVWSYYVAETLRGTAKRFTLRTDYRFGYDLEAGDILDFVPPWQAGVIKCRVLEVLFPFDAPAIELVLEEVV